MRAIKEYLTKAKNGELTEQYQSADYSDEELQFIFPSIRKLTTWAWAENQRLAESDRQSQFTAMHPDADVTPRHTFILVVTLHGTLKTLLNKYMFSRQRLYSLKISDMTSTEYAQFRKFIGGKE
ncbi:hypothetical protein [Spirosoma flavum]|uniref:Uncharacterized protein n=1 Tax=Spirosoma flavum TaxID=2048557 RepID=A0ABW6AP94_9BACT